MARFFRIQLDSIYLTETGLIGGTPCKLQLTGADALLSNFTGSVTPSVDGTPVMQIFENGTKGKVLEMRIETLLADVWTSVVALINTALENSETINIIGTGDVGNFNVDAKPLLPKPFEAHEFINGRLKSVVLSFITT